MDTRVIPKQMDRFVILYHQLSTGDHWDIMFEIDSALTTWSIPPQCFPGSPFVCPAVRLPDHRKHYLDYEGEVSGNRGIVSRIDIGIYKQLSQHQFILYGTIFYGRLTIETEKMTFEPGNNSNFPTGER